MAYSLTNSSKYLFTSESVTEGHPDKLCDQISDAILDDILRHDPEARVACETATTTGLVFVFGEISTSHYVDIPTIVRQTVKDAGYNNPDFGFDHRSCGISVSLKEQSRDISDGVTESLEVRGKNNQQPDIDNLGAGDQGMMVGFACTETSELMPLGISLAHKLCKRMSDLRNDGTLPYLRPDGKSQVTVEYEYGVPKRIDTVILSTQHSPDVDQSTIEKDLIDQVALNIIPHNFIDKKTKYLVNPSGRFVIGGPVGDAGLTGRKILVDTYGGHARHGGGAFSGKDPTKVDRSAHYAARYVAKNLVSAGVADRLEIQVSYAIGVAKPISIAIETFGTNHIDDEKIVGIVDKHFDLRPGAIIKDLNLRRPIYKQTAAFGHFGRDDLNLPWEVTDKAAIIKKELFGN